jgi:hypothetical protein
VTAAAGVIHLLMNLPRKRKRTRRIASVYVPGVGFQPIGDIERPDAR